MTNYEILGIPKTATLEEIKAAYRANAKQYHPDVNAAPNAAAMFCLVEQAYRELLHERTAPPQQSSVRPSSHDTQRPSESEPEPPQQTGSPSSRFYKANGWVLLLRILYPPIALLVGLIRWLLYLSAHLGNLIASGMVRLGLLIFVLSLLTQTWAGGTVFGSLWPFALLAAIFGGLQAFGLFLADFLCCKMEKLKCYINQSVH